ncbi:hypothetical protein M409DRAFT_26600 [Zasmidium cellare ATCC 36951]|uniref:Uncharacterized protein n=1 Tax=Zasmidium cellare ATCC 36951 TaxID=1080233 RepID=A0A6A6C7J1_ZASCE|nr:uncharacterized protein M409DRAFT_26600 [Zasmidium cellare ATCC 36951]KAF2163157.1 hypothetical protein M409DRAFT_26600 [Zasmidium cellare ATCC 36951]
MGWVVVNIEKDEPQIGCMEHCVLDPRLATALVIAAKVKELQGKSKASLELRRLALGAYKTINGVEHGFEMLQKTIDKKGALRSTNLKKGLSDCMAGRGHQRLRIRKSKDIKELTSGKRDNLTRKPALQTFNEAAQIYKDMIKTYETTRYENELSLMKPTGEALAKIEAMIRYMNLHVDLNEDKPMLQCRENSITDHRLVIALLIAAKLKKKEEGKSAAVEELESLAAGAYRTINGVDNGFEGLRKSVNGKGFLRLSHLGRCEGAVIPCGRSNVTTEACTCCP